MFMASLQRGQKAGMQKQHVDARIFGRKLAEQPPDGGFGRLPFLPENLIQVPGITPHWAGELKLRRDEILQWGNRSIQQKILSVVKKSSRTSSFEGHDLKDNVQLKDPYDAPARLNLAYKVSKKEAVSPETNRNMLLQATLALELNDAFLPDMLSLYQKVQMVYFNRVSAQCEDIVRQFPAPEALGTVDKVHRKNAIRTKNMIQAYQSSLQSEVHEAIAAFKNPIAKAQWDSSQKKNMILQNCMNATKVLKCFPLLLPMAYQLSQKVIEFDRQHPIGYFLNARVHKAEAKFLNFQYTNDYSETQVRNQINTHLQHMVKAYKVAMDKIRGKYDGLHLELLDEYVSAVTTFYSDINKIIKAKARPEVFIQLNQTLMAASSSDEAGRTRIEGFIEKNRNLMQQWGIPIPG